MPNYRAPIQDMRFILEGMMDLPNRSADWSTTELDSEMLSGVLDGMAKLSEDAIFPLNLPSDQEGCTLENGEVRTPAGFKAAYQDYVDGGWGGLAFAPEHGGMGLPYTLSLATAEMLTSAGISFDLYASLTACAYVALAEHGDAFVQRVILPKLSVGAWTGAMNLTEPHCGTDLGLLRTKAEPLEDGTYAITGQKIFISSGDHDLTDNVVHLVLARLPDAPKGTKGISLFLVSKHHLGEDGTLGARNSVSVGALEEKMGIHGNATCVMNFDGAVGRLIGQPHQGLRAMFTMMNEARLGTSIQALGVSEVAYQNAAAYALDRRQGRALTGPKDTEASADRLIVHPDIRRMLMNHKAFNEAARCFLYDIGLRLDEAKQTDDETRRSALLDEVALLTPVAKAVTSDKAFEHAVSAQQVLGGHGYVREWGLDQYVRDARILMIYEGANGVQALDLVTRKLALNGGETFTRYIDGLIETANAHCAIPSLSPIVVALDRAIINVNTARNFLAREGRNDADALGAGSYDFLHLFGATCLLGCWLRMAAKATTTPDDAFCANKLTMALYFADRTGPLTDALAERICQGTGHMMALPEDAFLAN